MLCDYALIQLFQWQRKQRWSRGAAQFLEQLNGFPVTNLLVKITWTKIHR